MYGNIFFHIVDVSSFEVKHKSQVLIDENQQMESNLMWSANISCSRVLS